MSNKDFNIFNFEGFIAQFMQRNDLSFLSNSKSLQLYPLSIATALIQPPTPLFRTQYNFLLLFKKGGGVQQVDNEIVELATNDILFVREGHLNAIKNIDTETDGFFIYIANSLLDQILVEKTLLNKLSFHPKISISSPKMDWLIQCCELMLQQKGKNDFSQAIQASLLKAMIMKIAESTVQDLPYSDRPTQLTMKFKELLYINFIDQREVTFYAHSLRVTENYLNRCVKQITKKPPKQHINEMIIHYSKTLLIDRSKMITEVAFALEFSDPSYFGRLFKKITGMTPSAYRDSFMQDLSEE